LSSARPQRAATTIELPADLRSPAQARRHVTDALRSAGLDRFLDDALLLVTELVTNAVVHAGTRVRLGIDTIERDRVRFEINDRSAETAPAAHTPSDISNSGRGLMLLNALAATWGTTHGASEKSVWFTLGVRPAGEPDSQPTETAPRRPELPPPSLDATMLGSLLMLDARSRGEQLDPVVVLGEALHRLCDVLNVESALLVEPDTTSPDGFDVLAERGIRPADDLVLGEIMAHTHSTAVSLRSFPVSVAGEALAVLVLDDGPALAGPEAIAVQLTCERMAAVLTEQRLRVAATEARAASALVTEASELFASTLDAMHALHLTTQLVVPRFGGWAAAWSIGEDGPILSAVHHEVETQVSGVRDALESGPGDSLARGLAHRLRSTQTVVLSAADLPAGLHADSSGDVLAVGLTARRTLLAVLVVAASPGAWSSRRAYYDAESVATVLDLATRAAACVDAALMFADQREVAAALQAALLPPTLPTSTRFELAARYGAAGGTNTVGGDFYDVFSLDDEHWAVVIGDVCGRGPEAAAITGLARSVLRVSLRDGRSSAGAFARLNREILDLGGHGRFCTSAIALAHPERDRTSVRLTLAGHPQPVLARTDGWIGVVGAPGTLIGVTTELSLHETEIKLGPGDALVLYTDGVTERRRGTAMLGESGLVAAIAGTVGSDVEQLVEQIEQTLVDFSPEPARDDHAVVVVRQPVEVAAPFRPVALGRTH
jgi:serine phosphatase RsbU (regulator of sigma subunit)/anti-sigma regulatory factor (Ser/Thr protein kinase)